MRIQTREKRRLALPAILQAHPTLLATLLFTLIVVAGSWPILTRLNSVVVGDDIDVYINLWADWWTLKAWTEPGVSLWQSDYIFFPRGADLTYHSFSHLNTTVSLLLRPIFGALGAYNVTILTNYVLIALSMFHLARAHTGSFGAGLLAGIVFAFNSHALYQSCHPVLLSIWVLPWTTLFLLRALGVLEEGGESGDMRRNALLAAVFVFLAALVSVLMLVILALWLVLLFAGLVLARRLQPGRHWRPLAFFAAASTLLALPVVWPVLAEGVLGGDASFVTNPQHSLVTDLASLVTPHWVHWYVRGIYIGILPAALSVVALLRRRRALPWLALFVVGLLMAIGPVPMLDGEALDVTLPWSTWLALLLRNTYRLNILASLGLAMLVAQGWIVVRAQLPSRLRQPGALASGALAMLLALFIVLEYLAPGVPYTHLSAPRFYRQILAPMPADTTVAIVPTARQVDKVHLYYQTIHGKRMTNGVLSRPDGNTERFIRNNALLRAGHYELPPTPLPSGVRARRALRELALAGVDLLIVEKGWSDVDAEAWRAAIGEEPVYEDGGVVVYGTGD